MITQKIPPRTTAAANWKTHATTVFSNNKKYFQKSFQKVISIIVR
jgi:hypothetical protein